MTKPKFPGWRTMTGAQRRNAKYDAIIDHANGLAIEKAKAAGWFFDPAISKWCHVNSTACYVNNARWGRYACEDNPQTLPANP